MSETEPTQLTAGQRRILQAMIEFPDTFKRYADFGVDVPIRACASALTTIDLLTATVAEQAQEIERLHREWEDAVERERRLAPSLADTQVMARDAQAKLRAVEALHTDVLHRLASWAAANKRERQQGKSPTHLNAYTVALWLGVKEDELLAILTPEAQ